MEHYSVIAPVSLTTVLVAHPSLWLHMVCMDELLSSTRPLVQHRDELAVRKLTGEAPVLQREVGVSSESQACNALFEFGGLHSAAGPHARR